MIELGVEPGIESVTRLASRRELAGDVIWIGSLLVILGVARIALRRQTLKLARGRSRMAGIALE